MALTTFGENALLNLFRGTTITAPTHWYMGLFTTAPSAGGSGGVEVTGGSYARVAIETLMGAPTGSEPATSANSSVIAWVTATANWGTVTAWGIFDALTGGNLWTSGLFSGSPPATYPINNGNTPKFLAGAFSLTAT